MANETCITYTGLRAETPLNLITGTGKVYKNIDLSRLRDEAETDPLGSALANATLLGTTNEGTDITFNVAKDLREVEFAGKRGTVKGLSRLNSLAATLEMDLLEFDVQNLLLGLPGAEAVPNANGYTEIVPGQCLDLRDYCDNIAVVALHGERSLPVVIFIENAINLEDFSLPIPDNDEASASYTFTATYDSSTPDKPPFGMFVANEEGFYLSPENASETVSIAASPVDVLFDALWLNGYAVDQTISVFDDDNSGIAISDGSGAVTAGSAVHVLNLDLSAAVAGSFIICFKASNATDNREQSINLPLVITA